MQNKILGFLLYNLCRWFRSIDVLSVYFHNPSARAFEQFILWAKRKGYHFVDLNELLLYINTGVKKHKKIAYISLDDAWRGNLDLLPVVEKFQVPITIFAPVEPLRDGNFWWEYVGNVGGFSLVNKYKQLPESEFKSEVNKIKESITLERMAMTLAELKKISQHPLVDIQSHSYNHPILTNCTNESLDAELRLSKEELVSIIGREITAFSYPNGSLTNREVEAVRRYYDCAFTTESNYPTIGCDKMLIPRIALTDDYWSNLAKIVGGWNLIFKIKRILGR